MGTSGKPAGDNPNRNSLLDLKNFKFTFDVSNFIEPDVGCRILSGSVAASYWLRPCSIFIHVMLLDAILTRHLAVIVGTSVCGICDILAVPADLLTRDALETTAPCRCPRA